MCREALALSGSLGKLWGLGAQEGPSAGRAVPCRCKRFPGPGSSLPLSPCPFDPAQAPCPHPCLGLGHTGEIQQVGAWNWQADPEQWARSLRQQLNAGLLLVPDGEASSEAPESSHPVGVRDNAEQPWAGQGRQRPFLKAVTRSGRPAVLELLLAELQALFSAVLQDGSPAAWHYLHAVLGLLPPYRALFVGHLDLLPFLEQLCLWAPWIQSQLQLDLLGAIDQAFPRDASLLEGSAHVDCWPRKQRFHDRPPHPACPFVQARGGGRQGEEELATWLRPLTLPELQQGLGIVGAEVALDETQWQDGLSLLPLALATDIPVQYKSSDSDSTEEGPGARRETR